jgi:superfamily II DNA or RNA helicase
MGTEYEEFLKNKQFVPVQSGFDIDESFLPTGMFPHQKVCTKWALKRGRAALFLDTGMGKSICLLTWANCVANHTGGIVIVVAPLAVSHQIKREGEKFGIASQVVACDGDINIESGIVITNYEKLGNFDLSQFIGVVLDESSILKGFYGRVREHITDSFKDTPYKLSTTATPSPNDFMELGTQSEFLGIMTQSEMLAMFFVNDTSETQKWRLKGHGASKFWEWMSTWCIVLRKPSDLGFEDNGYNLPPLVYHEHIIETEAEEGLFVDIAQTLTERASARRDSVSARCEKAAQIANQTDGKCLIWCDRNDESETLTKLIDDAVEVKGSDKPKHKEWALLGFAEDDVRRLVSKPSICGFGLNYQSCNNMVFTGLSDSFEKFYQAIRRCWRFGQTKPVHVYIISSDKEGAVLDNIKRKQKQHDEMSEQMVSHMRSLTLKQIDSAVNVKTEYNPEVEMKTPEWLISEVA